MSWYYTREPGEDGTILTEDGQPPGVDLATLLDRGVKVMINSDDPAYFGGYVGENYLQCARALDLSEAQLVQLARNSIEAAFLSDERRNQLLSELEATSSER